jgi:transposase
MRRYGLRDDQFERIELLLPRRPGTIGRNSNGGNRLSVEAVIWKFRSSAPWRDLALGKTRTKLLPLSRTFLSNRP